MTNFSETDAKLPEKLLLLPIGSTTLFPSMVAPIVVSEGKLIKTAELVIENGGYLGVVFVKSTPNQNQKDQNESFRAFYDFGIAAKVIKKINLPDNQISILLAGLKRFKIERIVETEPCVSAMVSYLEEEIEKDTELEALTRNALSQFKQLSKDNPFITDEMKVALMNIEGPGRLADFLASIFVREIEDYQKVLSLSNVKERFHHLLVVLKKELEVLEVQKKIQENVNMKISSAQKEYYLSEQLKLIQKELGAYTDERTKLIDKFKKRLETKTISDDIKSQIDEEFEKLSGLNEQSSEYSVSVNYLDCLTSLPWGIFSEDNLDLYNAKKILDKDHFGLSEVKERILEFLAVKKLKKSVEGSIICFVGPPGTGKTSLGRSIARALGRKYFRFSVGGMRDEAEIKGHRRTYVGAMPGKVIQGLRRTGIQNPLFLIDEIDKLGATWNYGGDPASAMLELLDGEQNSAFLDHYVDIPFDCSKIFFITTANTEDSILVALRDRMEIIHLHGYTDFEKLSIAKKHLIPKEFDKHAIKKSKLLVTDSALKKIISSYARDAGVRTLEKSIAKICRKEAYRFALNKNRQKTISAVDIPKYLGIAPFQHEKSFMQMVPGVALGLAWTQFGGDVLAVECIAIPGKGELFLTGQLGDVMKESANIAFNLVKSKSESSQLAIKYFRNYNIHLHVPAGATPKDGPSAGITMAASIYSLVMNKKVNNCLAMTGELTLTGKVLPVGGIKEKILAAKRANIKTVLIPKANEPELKTLNKDLKEGITFFKVNTFEDVLNRIF